MSQEQNLSKEIKKMFELHERRFLYPDSHLYDFYEDNESINELSTFFEQATKDKCNVAIYAPIYSTFVPLNPLYSHLEELLFVIVINKDYGNEFSIIQSGYITIEQSVSLALSRLMIIGCTKFNIRNRYINSKVFRHLSYILNIIEKSLTLTLPQHHYAFIPFVKIECPEPCKKLEKRNVSVLDFYPYIVIRPLEKEVLVAKAAWQTVSTNNMDKDIEFKVYYFKRNRIALDDFPLILTLHRWNFIPSFAILSPKISSTILRVEYGRVEKSEFIKYLITLNSIGKLRNRNSIYNTLWQGIESLYLGLVEPIWRSKVVYMWRFLESVAKFVEKTPHRKYRCLSEVLDKLESSLVINESEKDRLEILKSARNSIAHQSIDAEKKIEDFLEIYHEISALLKSILKRVLHNSKAPIV